MSDPGVPATQAEQGVQATQAEQGVPATQAEQGVQATQAEQGVQATQAEQGVQATQAEQGVQATQAEQGVQATNGDGDGTVQAAGGVVWRRGGEGTEVLLVHRPKYDDWSLPKGKLAPGETYEEGALREVAEETGLRCSLGPEVAATTYTDSLGRPKVVRYWAMQPEAGEFRPNHEVDETRWVGIDDAADLLSYDRDRAVLASLPG